MATHELKTLPNFFKDVWAGKKNFEVRKNDRDFKTGDFLKLKEWSPKGGYSGRSILAIAQYILTSEEFEGIASGYCIMALRVSNHYDRVNSIGVEKS